MLLLSIANLRNFSEGVGIKGTLLLCWWECKLVQPISLENSMQVPQKTKNRFAIWYSSSTPGCIYLHKTIIQKDICNPVSIAALFIIAKTWKQPKCSLTDE